MEHSREPSKKSQEASLPESSASCCAFQPGKSNRQARTQSIQLGRLPYEASRHESGVTFLMQVVLTGAWLLA